MRDLVAKVEATRIMEFLFDMPFGLLNMGKILLAKK